MIFQRSLLLLVFFLFFLLSFHVQSILAVPRAYPNGRAFPGESLSYVKLRFKEVNHNITWDTLNYLEAMSANLSSCNYPGGMMDGYAKIPGNSSWVAFIEFQNTSVTARKDVVEKLNPVIDMWISRKKYNVQIAGASKFGCSANPGCGVREGRMAISCVFTPSSPKYIPEPHEYDDVVTAEPVVAPSAMVLEGSDPVALTLEQYAKGQLITGKRWERGHFLENLSRLETNCEMLTVDRWGFTKHRPVIFGLDSKPEGFTGSNKAQDDVDMAIDMIMQTMKDKLPPNIQIGCTYIPDCRQDGSVWVVLSCLYEERCRKKLCF